MRKIFLLLLFCSLWYLPARAQRENVWVYSQYNGLDFNVPGPLSFVSVAFPTGAWNSASVCDLSGQLLFYTDGNKVWDRFHTVMPNGTDLLPLSVYALCPVNTMIVPMPDSAGKYYIFAITGEYEEPRGALYYSIVDMDLNGGLGDVVAGRNGIFVDSNLAPILQGVAGTDCNVWAITMPLRSAGEDNRYKAFEINAAGVNPNPVISVIPGVSTSVTSNCDISPDGKKFAFAGDGAEIYDFDAATGVISNPILLDPALGCVSVCFSPDNNKLYTNGNSVTMGVVNTRIDQYDITSNNAAAIMASGMQVASPLEASPMKRAPNGRLYYFGQYFGASLGCIQFPNLAGMACSPNNSAIPLAVANPGEQPYTLGSFPNSIAEARKPDTLYYRNDTTFCTGSPLSLAALPGYSGYKWDDGSAGTLRKVGKSGIYWVYQKSSCHTRVDSFFVREKAMPVANLGQDVMLCAPGPYTLKANVAAGTQVEWSTGSRDRVLTVQDTGRYWVTVTDPPCSSSDTIHIGLDLYCDCVPLLPNAFSPNNDGLNDVFGAIVNGSCPISRYSLQIYNRWGELVYSTVNHKNSWDGTTKGQPADPGTYTYQLNFESGSRKKSYSRKGDITLLR
ncbi:gliding motility-associated C-terminal domain-containing protein [Taibaiella chishuiensis]|uniref:Gliding motility-associated-like protein n=1 Tax=Taibaiella chishuiensis TaxID=1434707 RepID=A0A2P8CT35_9BACT|nr:gliding motility-associated C-terminal domain-containing protein [Taibaiella chishuiensis]PSK88131.1 gliding motility-associated-like protein [Taibaiella chishuiensis]